MRANRYEKRRKRQKEREPQRQPSACPIGKLNFLAQKGFSAGQNPCGAAFAESEAMAGEAP